MLNYKWFLCLFVLLISATAVSADFSGLTINQSTINASLPNPSFTWAYDSTTHNTTFTSTNDGAAASAVSWQFGDGQTSITVNPIHIYTNTTTYNVKLTMSNAAGSVSINKTIAPNPTYKAYSEKADTIFTNVKDPIDFVYSMWAFYGLWSIPSYILTMILITLLFYMIYTKVGAPAATVGAMCFGGVIFTQMPPAFAPLAFWCILLGGASVVYPIIIQD